MLGTKLYKNNTEDMARYTDCAITCNEAGNLTIEDKGEYYECVAIPTPSLDELKAQKLTELKSIRDTAEVEPIEYNGNLYDYDDKARERSNAAIIALEVAGVSDALIWTTADNQDVKVTANDLRMVIAAVAVRSNELHIKYRELNEQVEACTTKEELDSIKWGGENSV